MKRRDAAITAVAVGALLVLALAVVFAAQLSSSQEKAKREIESRVRDRAVLTGALIDSVFGYTARNEARQDKPLGSPTVSRAVMDRLRQQNTYSALIGAHDRVIAASHGFTPQARADLRISAALALLRAGHPWALGNVLPYGRVGVVNFGVALHTRSGTRYLLTGFDPYSLAGFLGADLHQIPGQSTGKYYVTDGKGYVLQSTAANRPPGYVFHTAAQLKAFHTPSGTRNGYFFLHVPMPHTTWVITLASTTGPLFASISGVHHWIPWFILIAFGVVALVTVLLAARALHDSELVSIVNAKLADSNRALERSNAELERHARELVRSNTELDQFASIASHDLQEPLRKVRTFTERISETEADALSDRGMDYLRRANASAERMQTLIEDLLRYSRVSTRGRPFAAVDLGRVTQDVLEDLSEQVSRAGAVVRVGDLPTINADASQMRQLMQNLISNALRFQREEVTPALHIDSKVEPGWVTITVRDNGIGFDPQYSRRIFRVFERLHGRGTYPGTGIGLALCRKIAERHGGTIVASSVPGEGSTFTVTLQTQRTEAVSDAPPSAGAASVPANPEEPYVAV